MMKRRSPLHAESVEIPIGLPEVDLSAFSSSKNRTSPLVLSVSVRLVGGSLTASPSFSGGGPLLQVSGGCSVVLDQSAAIDAGSAPTSGCMAAVGIYGGSTFFQYGNVTALASGAGIAIYIDSKQNTYRYYAGQTKGSISNEQGGQVIGVDENPQYNNGDTFAALTPEGVTMTFQVISASARTCRVGNGSAAAIATATKGIVTIPQKAKGYTVVKISNRAFIECSQLSFIGIPSTVTEIGETTFGSAVGAFHACSGITSFDIPGSVTLIGRGTFSSCVSLTELTIPSSVTVIGSNAFDYCTGLKSLTLSPNITAIELETFRNCQSLESLTIPASVRSFGNSAFQGCNSLKTLTSLVQQPFTFGSGVFSSYDVRLYVPAGTKSRYQNTACWNRFYHIYTIGTNEELEDIQEMFVTISQQLDALAADQELTAQQAAVVKSYLGNAELNSLIDTQLTALKARLSALRATYEQIKSAGGGSAADTVFVNRGTFYFYGGISGGNGSRLVYHGPGATMRIDGGHFEFNLVKHYWIEAHSFFYIRGDYDYGATMPMLLAPSVTIRLLGSWTYTFPLQFIGGLPTSHYALFRAEGFTLVRDYFGYINWTLPGSRWRWYLNEGDNAIEPRGEEVEDEDDLQAYLDWLAANQDDEAASSEEQPQQLDLGGRTIAMTRPVEIPANVFVAFSNGTLQGNITPSWQPEASGAVVSVDPSSRLYLGSICLQDVVLRVNVVVNIYITGALTGRVYVYAPTDCLYENFRLLAPWGGYRLSLADMGCLRLLGTSAWGIDFDTNGYAALFDLKNLGDVNRDGRIDIADMQRTIAIMARYASGRTLQSSEASPTMLQSLEASPTMLQSSEASPTMLQSLEASPTMGTMRADVNRDGRITNADVVELIRMAER